MPNNPVSWFEIYVQDMERAKRFYETVFQCKLGKLNNPYLELWGFPMDVNGYGVSGALVRMEGCVSGGGGTLVYFRCTDCAESAARATAAGGRISKPKMAIGQYGFISLVVDTEGNMIGLHSMQ
jgi:uncharacterized protein